MIRYKYEITSTEGSRFSFAAAGQFDISGPHGLGHVEAIFWFERIANAHFSKLGSPSLGDVLVLDLYERHDDEPISSDKTMIASAHHVLIDGQRMVKIQAGHVIKAFNKDHVG